MPTATIPAAITAIATSVGAGAATAATIGTIGAGAIAAGGLGLAASTLSSIGGGAPAPPAPVVQPDLGPQQTTQAQKSVAMAAQQRSGRASTILSTPALTDYSSPTLGGG